MPIEIPGMAGSVGMINLSDMMGKAFGQGREQATQIAQSATPGPSWSTKKPKDGWTRTRCRARQHCANAEGQRHRRSR